MPRSKDSYYGPPHRGPPRGPMMMGPPPHGPHGPYGSYGPPPKGSYGPRMMPGPGPRRMQGPPRGPPYYPDRYERSRSPGRGRGHEPDATHLPLAKCRVLYLGSAVPTETARGLEAVQVPLKERFPLESDNMAGIDAWLTVFSSGIMMQYVANLDNVAWFPIQTLHVCAAVKCVVNFNGTTGERSPRFVALDSPKASNSTYPPLFCAIMRRTRGMKVLECHSFICKSSDSAMALVQAAVHAFKHKEGWCKDEPPQARIKQAIHLIPADPVKDMRSDFYRPPPQEGYFYSSNRDVIRSYNVKERSMHHPHMSDPYGAPGGPKVGQLPPHPRGYFSDWQDFGDPVFIHKGGLFAMDARGRRSPSPQSRYGARSHHSPQSRNGARSRHSPHRRAINPHERRSPIRHYDSEDEDDMFRKGPPANLRQGGSAASEAYERRLPEPTNRPKKTTGDNASSSSKDNYFFGAPNLSKNPTPRPFWEIDDAPSSSDNLIDNSNFSFGAPKNSNKPDSRPSYEDKPSSNNLIDNSNFSFGAPKVNKPDSRPSYDDKPSSNNLISNSNFSFGAPNIRNEPDPPSEPVRDNPLANLNIYASKRRGDVRNLFT